LKDEENPYQLLLLPIGGVLVHIIRVISAFHWAEIIQLSTLEGSNIAILYGWSF